MFKNNKEKNMERDNFSNWARPTLEALCYHIGYEKTKGKSLVLREHSLSDSLKPICNIFFKEHKFAHEKKYSELIDDEKLILEFRKSLKGKKKDGLLDVALFSKNQKVYPNYYIEIKRYFDSKESIEEDVIKLSNLIKIIRRKKNNNNVRGFVLVISQKEIPAFIIDSIKLISDKKRKVFTSKKGTKGTEYSYINRVTCKLIAKNISSLVKEDKSKIHGIFASFIEVEI
jgi:hypothetical protein